MQAAGFPDKDYVLLTNKRVESYCDEVEVVWKALALFRLFLVPFYINKYSIHI